MSDLHNSPSLPPAISNSSRFPQRETAARLPPSSQQKLCEPCKAFLRGGRIEYIDPNELERSKYQEHVHHPDANSFREALELPCDICIRFHKTFNRHIKGILSPMRTTCNRADSLLTIPGEPTHFTGPTRYDYDTEKHGFRFSSQNYHIYTDLESFECKEASI
jgi:hypothetical protein